MIVYMDLENLLKEKNISKNKLCEACNLQRTQLNNYCKNKVSRIDFTILAKLCEFLDCTPNDILKLSMALVFSPVPFLMIGFSITFIFSSYDLIAISLPQFFFHN